MPPKKKPSKSSGKPMSPADLAKAMSAKMAGAQVISDSDQLTFLSSGHLGLNYIISGKWIEGGFPEGRMVEIYGPSQSAKSTLGYLAMVGCLAKGGGVAYIDSEGGCNPEFMKTIGVDIGSVLQLVPRQGDHDCYSIEKCFREIYEWAKGVRAMEFDGPLMVLFDSIAACPAHFEWEQLIKGDDISEDRGRRAKLISQSLRTYNKEFRKLGVAVYVINQLREKSDAGMYEQKEITTSGKSLAYYCDTRIEIRRKKTIKRQGTEKKHARILGGYFNIQCTKTRDTSPFRMMKDVELFFELGISPTSGIFDMMLADDLIIPASRRGYYVLADPKTRNSPDPQPADGAEPFTKKDVLTGNWVMDNFEFFGASSRDEMVEALKPCQEAFNLSKLLIDPKNAEKFLIEDTEDGEEVDENVEPDALSKIRQQGGGKIIQKKGKSAPVPDDETGDDDDDYEE